MLVCVGSLASVLFPSSFSLERATGDCKKLVMCEEKRDRVPRSDLQRGSCGNKVEHRLHEGLLLPQIYAPMP